MANEIEKLREECRIILKRADVGPATITQILGSKRGKITPATQLPSFKTLYKIYRVCGDMKKLFEYYEAVKDIK